MKAPSKTQTPNQLLFDSARLGDALGLEKALQQGADLNTFIRNNQDELNALMVAAEHGSIECLKRLLSLNHPALDPNRVTSNWGCNALMLAAKNSHLECVKALIPLTDASRLSRGEINALGEACGSDFQGPDNLACVRALLAVSDPKTPLFRGMRALALAAYSSNTDACALLLPLTDPNHGDAPYSEDVSALGLAAASEAPSPSCVALIAPACSFALVLRVFCYCLAYRRIELAETLLGARPDLLSDPHRRALDAMERESEQNPELYAEPYARAMSMAERGSLSSATEPRSAHPRAAAHRL